MDCPICEKKTDQKYRPFCSKRCADYDLGKWLTQSYRIEGKETDDNEAVSRENNQMVDRLN